MAGQVEGGLPLRALPPCLLYIQGIGVHVLLPPAFAPEVVDVDAPQQLGLIGAGTSGDVGDGAEEKQRSLDHCGVESGDCGSASHRL